MYVDEADDFIDVGLDPLCSFFSEDKVAVIEGGSNVGTNDRVNEVLVMGFFGDGWIKYGLLDHVGDLGQKISWQSDVNVGAEDMTGAVDVVF